MYCSVKRLSLSLSFSLFLSFSFPFNCSCSFVHLICFHLYLCEHLRRTFLFCCIRKISCSKDKWFISEAKETISMCKVYGNGKWCKKKRQDDTTEKYGIWNNLKMRTQIFPLKLTRSFQLCSWKKGRMEDCMHVAAWPRWKPTDNQHVKWIGQC